MTKKELIKEIHKNGEFWANETYSKKELEDHLKGLEKAKKLDLSELVKLIWYQKRSKRHEKKHCRKHFKS